MQLKQDLMTSRTIFTKEGWKPECGYCGKPIMSGGEMHEAIITRGDVRLVQRSYQVITNRCNCVIVHSECHASAATKEGAKRILAYLVRYEGRKNMLFWLSSIASQLKEPLEINALMEQVMEVE